MFSKIKISLLLIILISFIPVSYAQVNKDSIPKTELSTDTVLIPKKDTSAVKKHSPRIATFRSAVLPGWGQAYNKKYWKIPIVYAALGITTGVFLNNLKTYKLLRSAYIYRTDTITANDALIDPRFKNLSVESIRSYRNTFRQNMDYSILVFILAWGLNVVDATVDAHLKGFDVSDDLTLKIIPGRSQMANTNGISLVLRFKDNSRQSSVISRQ